MTLAHNVSENLTRHWPLLVIVAIWFGWFFQVISGQSAFGFRDSAYYFYPYFYWIDLQWRNGDIPLWNPFCDHGFPVVADGSSSVFYPLKAIFFLRILSYPARYGIYVSIHVLIAALTSYFLTFKLSRDPLGAGFAAFSYAFGGSVLFQVSNVIFLVSASWLPLGFYCILNMFRKRGLVHAFGMGVVASLMILGGDPQMAFVCGALSFFTLALPFLFQWRKYRPGNLGFAKISLGFKRLMVFVVIAFGLAAVQILPTYYWSQQSERRAERLPFHEKTMEPMGYLATVYEFSQPPWTMAEMVFPNVFGKPFPISSRWSAALPGADRIWTPSVYVGLLPLVIAILACRFRRSGHRQTWLTLVAIVFAFGSFGWFGAFWLVNEISISLLGKDLRFGVLDLGPQAGGVYWLATVLLPGFEMFRYPAKLFTVASLAICVLGGIQFSKLLETKSMFLCRALMLVCIISVLGLACTEFFVAQLEIRIGGYWDSLFGPLDFKLVEHGLYGTFLHSFSVAGISLLVWMFWQNSNRTRSAKTVLLFVAIMDVGVANHWLSANVKSDVFTKTTKIETRLASLPDAKSYRRLLRRATLPNHWIDSSSPNRLSEVIEWWRETLHPKFHLMISSKPSVNLIGSFSSIEHKDSRQFRRQTRWFNGSIDYHDPQGPYVSTGLPGNAYFRLVKPSVAETADWEMELQVSPVAEVGELELQHVSARMFKLKCKVEKSAMLLCNLMPSKSWKVRLTDDSGTIKHVELKPANNEFFSTIEVDAGTAEIQLIYSPIEFWTGLTISIVFLAVAVLAASYYWLRLGLLGRVDMFRPVGRFVRSDFID